MKRTWKNQFTGLGADMPKIANKLESLGFIDESWGNDICPKFFSIDLNLMVWVDYENENDREFKIGKRFAIVAQDDDCIFETDSFNELDEVIKKIIETKK